MTVEKNLENANLNCTELEGHTSIILEREKKSCGVANVVGEPGLEAKIPFVRTMRILTFPKANDDTGIDFNKEVFPPNIQKADICGRLLSAFGKGSVKVIVLKLDNMIFGIVTVDATIRLPVVTGSTKVNDDELAIHCVDRDAKVK